MAVIWADTLKIEKVGIHDNFFRIGGDSIISIQLVAKGRQQSIYFNVKDVFNHPTIASLISVAKIQEDALTLKPDQGVTTGEVSLTAYSTLVFLNKIFLLRITTIKQCYCKV